ncbi:MAG: class I adenylate-forming enzyme family protein [Bdellovibrionota bacterium]
MLAAITCDLVPCIVPPGQSVDRELLPLCIFPGPPPKSGAREGDLFVSALGELSGELGLPAAGTGSGARNIAKGTISFFSSGTTARQKQISHSTGSLLFLSDYLQSRLNLKSDSVSLVLLPMSQVSANLLQFWPAFLAGAQVGLFSFDFEFGSAVENILLHQASHLTLTPYFLHLIAREVQKRGGPFIECVKYVSIAGDRLLPAHLSSAKQIFPAARIFKGYGLTEAPRVAMLGDDDPQFSSAAVGRVLPGIEVEIRADNHQVLPPGAIGELFIRGPNLALPSTGHTESPLGEDGFLRTGDLGALSADGLLYLEGRKSAIFKFHDRWIAPGEVESIAARGPGVITCACLSSPGPEGAHPILALEAEAISPEEFALFLRKNLARHQVPREVYLMTKFPLLAAGKVDRGELARLLEEKKRGAPPFSRVAGISFWTFSTLK